MVIRRMTGTLNNPRRSNALSRLQVRWLSPFATGTAMRKMGSDRLHKTLAQDKPEKRTEQAVDVSGSMNLRSIATWLRWPIRWSRTLAADGCVPVLQ